MTVEQLDEETYKILPAPPGYEFLREHMKRVLRAPKGDEQYLSVYPNITDIAVRSTVMPHFTLGLQRYILVRSPEKWVWISC